MTQNTSPSKDLRLLSVIRLSRETDETTSPQSQREMQEGYAALNHHTITATASDLDVKGNISPFDRDELGVYLSDPVLIGTWDAIIISKLDRLSRSVVDFASLLEWCRNSNKSIISVSEHLDFSTAAGVMFANVLIAFAQFERERMAERRRDAAKTLRETGRWGGGQVWFGYQPQRDGDGWILVPDPAIKRTANTMADRIISGDSLSSVARWLNETEISTPRGQRKAKGKKSAKVYRWWPATVRDVLRSPTLLGQMTHKGAIVRDDEGMPIAFDPLITEEKWDRLQAALDAASNPLRGERGNGAYLLRIAYCPCGEPLHQTTTGSGNRYYRCHSIQAGHPCGRRRIPYDALNAKVNEDMSGRNFELMGKRPAGQSPSHTKEIDEIGRQIAELTQEHFVRRVIRPDFHEVMTNLQDRYDTLASEAPDEQPQQFKPVGTGRYLSDEWPTWDETTRRRFLVNNKFHFTAYRDQSGEIHLDAKPGTSFLATSWAKQWRH